MQGTHKNATASLCKKILSAQAGGIGAMIFDLLTLS